MPLQATSRESLLQLVVSEGSVHYGGEGVVAQRSSHCAGSWGTGETPHPSSFLLSLFGLLAYQMVLPTFSTVCLPAANSQETHFSSS